MGPQMRGIGLEQSTNGLKDHILGMKERGRGQRQQKTQSNEGIVH